jgi:hypothetical protein
LTGPHKFVEKCTKLESDKELELTQTCPEFKVILKFFKERRN